MLLKPRPSHVPASLGKASSVPLEPGSCSSAILSRKSFPQLEACRPQEKDTDGVEEAAEGPNVDTGMGGTTVPWAGPRGGTSKPTSACPRVLGSLFPKTEGRQTLHCPPH